MRKLKFIGLAVIAACAFSAVATAAATRPYSTDNDEDDRLDLTKPADPTLLLLDGGDTTTAVRNEFACGTPVNTVTGNSNNERKLTYEVGKRDKSLT